MTFEEKVAEIKIAYPNIDIEKRMVSWKSKNPNIDIEDILNRGLARITIFFVLRVGYSCNMKCIHCFVEDKKVAGGDLTLDQLKSIVDTIDPKKIITITVTGGEPTVREDILEILKYVKEKGYLIDLQSNGAKFENPEYLKKIEPYFDTIFLPIHSNNPNIFDAITQVPRSADQVMQGFKNLVDSSIQVVTQTVINQLNYKTLLETFDFIQAINPGGTMSLTFPDPVGAAADVNVTPQFSEVRESVQKVLKKYGYLISTHYIPRCILYPYQAIINVVDDDDGGNKPKPGIDYIENGWAEVDYGSYFEASRIKLMSCKSCKFNTECLGVWKEYFQLYPDLNKDLVPITN